MAKNSPFGGKEIGRSDIQLTEAGDGPLGYTFRNNLNELSGEQTGHLKFIGCTNPGEDNNTPFDKFKAQDPSGMNWAGGM